MIGGSPPSGGVSASAQGYDPVTDTWTDGPSLDTARTTLGAAAVGNVIYAYAGYNGDAYTPSSHFTSLEALTVSEAPPPTDQCATDLAAALEEIASLQEQVGELQAQLTSLTQQNASLSAQVVALTAENAQLQATANAVSTDLAAVQQDLARAFSNSGFQLPGATPVDQLNNLIRAILDLNLGRKQGVYKNLGGR